MGKWRNLEIAKFRNLEMKNEKNGAICRLYHICGKVAQVKRAVLPVLCVLCHASMQPMIALIWREMRVLACKCEMTRNGTDVAVMVPYNGKIPHKTQNNQ